MAATGLSATAAAGAADEASELRREAVRLGRYVLGVTPGDALVDRYVRAHATALAGEPTPADEAVLAFVARHPWALPLLDAGTAFTPSAPRLRRKLVVMLAILEATPDLADRTLPVEDGGLVRLVARVGLAGATAGLKLALGLPLALALVRRARR